MEKRKLRSWLDLAHKWGAVMLIDEADVFLEKRMDSDIKRNSLVSSKEAVLPPARSASSLRCRFLVGEDAPWC